jgi:hypothetical protein
MATIIHVGGGGDDYLDGVPKSISFSYGGTSAQRYEISAPLLVNAYDTATVNISPEGYGEVFLLGLAKNGTGWTTIKSGAFSGTIDCSNYVALAIKAGGYELSYGASGSGTISVG